LHLVPHRGSDTTPLPLPPAQPGIRGHDAAQRLRVNTVEIGAPGGNRTPDPQLRRLMLYPTELRARGPTISGDDPRCADRWHRSRGIDVLRRPTQTALTAHQSRYCRNRRANSPARSDADLGASCPGRGRAFRENLPTRFAGVALADCPGMGSRRRHGGTILAVMMLAQASPAVMPPPPPKTTGSIGDPSSPPNPPTTGSIGDRTSPPNPPTTGSIGDPTSPPNPRTTGSVGDPTSPPNPPTTRSIGDPTSPPNAPTTRSIGDPASPPNPPTVRTQP